MVTHRGAVERTFDRRSFCAIRQSDKNIIGDKPRALTLSCAYFGANDDLSVASAGLLRRRHQVPRDGTKFGYAGRFFLATNGKKRNHKNKKTMRGKNESDLRV